MSSRYSRRAGRSLRIALGIVGEVALGFFQSSAVHLPLVLPVPLAEPSHPLDGNAQDSKAQDSKAPGNNARGSKALDGCPPDQPLSHRERVQWRALQEMLKQ
jgi:hypothetical protein